MDVRQLEYFLAVVDNGGVNRAAAALHVAQPSLSQSIRKLEKDLRTELFHRVGRGIVLAPAGEALVGPARQILRDMDSAREAVREVRDVERGRIDIAGLSDMSTDPLSVWVAQFRVKNPNIHLRIEERDHLSEVIEMVKSGACELGITVLPLPREGVVDQPLGWQTFVLVLPPGTESEFPDPVPLESLTGIPLVMGERNTGSRDYVESMLRASGVEPRIAVEVPQRGAVVPMVLSGAGAAILPMRIALDAAQRGAVVRELAPELRRQMGVVHRPGRLTGAASAFLDQTKASLASWDRAVERRMASGLSRIEAAALTVSAVEKRQLEEFRIQSPISRLVEGNDIDR
ncbi:MULTISPECIES: LysR family transcriptional regulator [unclassified Rhodococcus (in: high G+C Gram-positive bacteria)]|uniref:LysR family transcriptional regulator n=1 Tax=unclassified Rhodococcus (in: high G+C Gram-positive bacteria) TaxID=192944 RepID=UPI001624E1CF|nr:LysR family transcriptional regulator [Rhodococcus sp. KBW08]